MADIFISYSRKDRDRIEPLAAALDAAGFSVWWDTNIQGGARFAAEITREVKAADVIIVAWSSESVKSEWVLDEAAQGRDDAKLAPIVLDDVLPPLGFRQRQAISFARWNGKSDAQEFIALKEMIARVREGGWEDFPEPDRQMAAANSAQPIAIAGFAALLIAAAAAYFLLGRGGVEEPIPNTFAIANFAAYDQTEDATRFSRALGDALERTLVTNRVPVTGISDANDASQSSAEFIFTGSVDSHDDTINTNINVTQNSTGALIWSHQAEFTGGDRQIRIDEIARSIAAVSKSFVYYRERMGNDRDAEFLALIFRYCEAEMGGGEIYGQIQELTRQIVERRPQYAISNSLYASALAWFAFWEEVPSEIERLSNSARDYARRALEIDPNDGQALWTLGAAPDPELTISEREGFFRKVTEADPSFLYGRRYYAVHLNSVGRLSEGAVQFQLAAEAEPLWPGNTASLVSNYARMGQLARAKRTLNEAQDKWPNDQHVRRAALRFESWYGDPLKAGNYTRLSADKDPSRKCLEATMQARRSNMVLSPEALHNVCDGHWYGDSLNYQLYFGHADEIFGMDEKELATRFAFHRPQSRVPLFEKYAEGVRADPRFMTFAARIGLVDYWLETNQWPDFCSEQEGLAYDCREAAMSAHNAAKSGRSNP